MPEAYLDRLPDWESRVVADRICLTIREHALIAGIVAVFVVLATTYSVVNPIFESPDEIYHYAVVKQIADGRGLPVQTPTGKDKFVAQEGAQPPLYYLIGAAATWWIDTGPADRIVLPNPHAAFGGVNVYDNRNLVMHDAADEFPYKGVPLAVHVIRFISILMGTGTVLLTYLIGLRTFSQSKLLAAGCAALVAFNPQFAFISGSVNNDNLITFLATATLLLAVTIMQGHASRARLLALSLVVGLATITKLSGLGTIGLAGLAVTVLAIRQRSARALTSGLSMIGVSVLLVSGWWYVRNYLLYGEPLGVKSMIGVYWGMDIGRGSPLYVLANEMDGLFRSYWAVFGWINTAPDDSVYNVFLVVCALGAVGLAVAVIKAIGKRSVVNYPAYLALIVWAMAIFAGHVAWNSIINASQGRLLFPAIASFSALLTLGLANIVPSRLRWLPIGAVSLSLLCLSASMPFTVIAPAYAKPSLVSVADLGDVPNPIHTTFDGKMELMGYSLEKRAVQPGETLGVTLYWRVMDYTDRDYSVFVHARDGAGELIAQYDSYPGGGAFRTSQLHPGQCFKHTSHLTVPAESREGTLIQIGVGLYDRNTFKLLPALDALGHPVPVAPAGRFRVQPTSDREYRPQNQLSAQFEHGIELLGYDMPLRQVAPGEPLAVTLYWRTLDSLDTDYTVFVHLIGPEGLVAQHDSLPDSGAAPTSTWQVGEVIKDDVELLIPADVTPGEYRLIVGLYELPLCRRLHMAGGDSVSLTAVVIAR